MEWEIIESRLKYLLENGRRIELRGALLMLNVVDIAQFMEGLDGEKMLMLFRLLPKDVSAEVFAYKHPLATKITAAAAAASTNSRFISTLYFIFHPYERRIPKMNECDSTECENA